MATFHHSETACSHFSDSLYYRNINRSLAKQDDAIRTEIWMDGCKSNIRDWFGKRKSRFTNDRIK